MTKEVMISVRGMQFEGSTDAENVEVIQKGTYYKRNGQHYLMYEEPVEGSSKTVKNLLKFNDRELYVSKKGMIQTNMTFRENEKNLTNYRTPYGDIVIGLDTRSVRLKESKDGVAIAIDYTLDVNYEFLSECKIRIAAAALS